MLFITSSRLTLFADVYQIKFYLRSRRVHDTNDTRFRNDSIKNWRFPIGNNNMRRGAEGKQKQAIVSAIDIFTASFRAGNEFSILGFDSVAHRDWKHKTSF